MPGIAVAKPVAVVLRIDLAGILKPCKLLTSRRCQSGSAPLSVAVNCFIRMVCSPRAFSNGSRRRTKDCRWSPVTSSAEFRKRSVCMARYPTSPGWHGESRRHRTCGRARHGTFCWHQPWRAVPAASSCGRSSHGPVPRSPASCRCASRAAYGGCAPASSPKSTQRVCHSTPSGTKSPRAESNSISNRPQVRAVSCHWPV